MSNFNVPGIPAFLSPHGGVTFCTGRYTPVRDGAFMPYTIDDLLSGGACQLASCDIARMNLLCATGLPGAEEVTLARYLRLLDVWTNRIEVATRAARPEFESNPGDYDHSLPFHQMLLLTTVLQLEFGVRYNT